MSVTLHVVHDDGRGDLPGRFWTNSEAECLACGTKWIATHPLACDALICPRCASADTVREDPESA